MKRAFFSLLALLLVGCGGRNTPTTVQYAADPSQSDESDVDDDDESHYLWNSKSTFRITYNNNRPIHGFRVHCEGTQYIYDDMIDSDFNLVFTNVKTGKSFKMDKGWFHAYQCDTLIPQNLQLKYTEGQTSPDYDDIFWFVDLDFDGQVELVTGNVFIHWPNYRGEDYFNRFYRIVDGELIDATQEFIAKNEDIFKNRVFRDAFYVDKKRQEIGLKAGRGNFWRQEIYVYEEDGNYRLDKSVCVEKDSYYDGRIVRIINVVSPQDDTLRRYEFMDAEFKYRLKNVEGFIENL